MAPNQRSLLLYENDDLERVAAFEKKGNLAVFLCLVWRNVSEQTTRTDTCNFLLNSLL